MPDEADRPVVYYRDKRTGFRFDPRVGEYELTDSIDFETRGLGYRVRYRGPGIERIDIFIYDLDVPDIPDGIEGSVRDEFVRSLAEMHEKVRSGDYLDFEVRLTEWIDFGVPQGPGPRFLHAAVSFAVADGGDVGFFGPRTSHLLIRGMGGMFLKIRYSHATEDTAAAQPRFGVFVDWLAGQFEVMH